MTTPDPFASITTWLTAHAARGHTVFTITDLHGAARALFPSHPIKRRMAYHICQQYVQILGIEPGRRLRRNMNEIVFTPEQASQILEGMQVWQASGQSYAEVFLQLRDAQRGGGEDTRSSSEGRSSSGGSPSSQVTTEQARAEVEELTEDVRSLRAEVVRLREVQADLLAEVRLIGERALTRDDLWRVVAGTLAVSVDASAASRVMGYVGVTNEAAEVAALDAAGLDRELLGL